MSQTKFFIPGVISNTSDNRGDHNNENHSAPLGDYSVQDKWVLSSALQKLIRRGKASPAIAVALRLHKVDGTYLPRRLPIIAVEDIGVGDIAACIRVLTVCSESRLWRESCAETIVDLVSRMAAAVKSRAACDAYCLSEVHPASATMIGELLNLAPAHLGAIASDRDVPSLRRMNALRVLGGITERLGAQYRTRSRCDSAVLDQVAASLGLSTPIRWLMGKNKRAGSLAAMLPIAVDAASGAHERVGGAFPHSLDTEEGVPLCGVDMFSEVGRGALREFFLSSPALMAFAGRSIHAKSPMRLFHMALFHAESSLLGRYLASPALDELTAETEHAEMKHLGMTHPSDRHELRDLIEAEAGRLAEIRRRRLKTSQAVASAKAAAQAGGANG